MFNTLLVQQPIGLVVGLLLAWWVAPTTTGGLLLTILIGLAIWNIIWQILKALLGLIGWKPRQSDKPSE